MSTHPCPQCNLQLPDGERHITKDQCIKALREQLDEYDATYRRVMAEQCAPDEKHCTCVPFLRIEVARQKALADAWQREANESKAKLADANLAASRGKAT